MAVTGDSQQWQTAAETVVINAFAAIPGWKGNGIRWRVTAATAEWHWQVIRQAQR